MTPFQYAIRLLEDHPLSQTACTVIVVMHEYVRQIGNTSHHSSIVSTRGGRQNSTPLQAYNSRRPFPYMIA
jgi:hypothetical protein